MSRFLGRSSDSRFVLPAPLPTFWGSGFARVVPDYSDGTVPDSHRLPYCDPYEVTQAEVPLPSIADFRNSHVQLGAPNRLAVSIDAWTRVDGIVLVSRGSSRFAASTEMARSR